MISIDIGPQYPDAEYIHGVQLVNEYDFVKPKHRKSTDLHPYLMLEPSKVDYRRAVLS